MIIQKTTKRVLTLTVAFIFVCVYIAQAGEFRIAGIFGEYSPRSRSAAQEIMCMTRAVVEEARNSGLNISLQFFDGRHLAYHTKVVSSQIVQERYDAVIGTNDSVEGLAAASVLNKNKIPLIVPNATHPDITKDKPYVLRVVVSDKIQAKILANYTANKIIPDHVTVIVNVSTAYSEFLASEYVKKLKEKRPDVEIKTFEIIDGYFDYKGLVNQILSRKTDLIFLPLMNPRVGKIYNELAKRKRKIKLLGGDGIGGRESFFRIVGKTSPNIDFVFVKHWNGTLTGPEVKNYEYLYKKYCSGFERHTFFTVVGYDTASLLVRVIGNNTDAKGSDIIRLMKRLKYHGLLGEMRFDKNGETIKPLHLFRLESNTIKFVESWL